MNSKNNSSKENRIPSWQAWMLILIFSLVLIGAILGEVKQNPLIALLVFAAISFSIAVLISGACRLFKKKISIWNTYLYATALLSSEAISVLTLPLANSSELEISLRALFAIVPIVLPIWLVFFIKSKFSKQKPQPSKNLKI